MSKPMPAPLFALVIDDERGVCEFLTLVLAKLGVESEVFPSAKPALESLSRRRPEVIFLDIALRNSDAVDVIKGLCERQYDGVVQLISGGRSMLLEAVHRMGVRHGMRLREPLQKPIRRDAIAAAIAELSREAAPRTPSRPM